MLLKTPKVIQLGLLEPVGPSLVLQQYSGDTMYTVLPSARNQPASAITLILTMETTKKEGGVERLEDDDKEEQSVREMNVELKCQVHEVQNCKCLIHQSLSFKDQDLCVLHTSVILILFCITCKNH